MTYPDRELRTDARLGLASRFLVSSSHRFSIPLRWLGDLARRGSLSYPAGQEYQKGRHLAKNLHPGWVYDSNRFYGLVTTGDWKQR